MRCSFRLRLATLATIVAMVAGSAAAAPQWQALPGAPTAIRIDGVHFVDPRHGWVCTGEGEIHRTTNGGASWERQLDDPALYFRCIALADTLRGWAGTLSSSALLHRTTNGGGDWSVVAGIPDPRPNALCGLAVPTSQLIVGVGSYAGPARVIRSTDGGTSWSSQDLAPLASTLIDVHFLSPTVGIAVGSVGAFPNSNVAVVMRTTDGGANWERRFLGTRLGEWGWKITFPTPAIGYVSLERNAGPMFFLKTVDGGLTWTEHAFPNYNEQGIGFVTPTVGWVGGAGNPTLGTTDGGQTWSPTPWGVYINRFQFLGSALGFATGVTVYRYAEEQVDVPDGGPPRAASRVAPNPFAARTTIEFVLPRATRVQLLVADPAGRVVRTIEDGARAAGPHRVDWDGRDDRGVAMPAGIYLYVLHAGERHEMGKLVRVR